MPSYYNKITVMDGNSVIREIDLSQDTVSSASHIVSGYYGHLNTGERVLGTGQGGGTPSATAHTIAFTFTDNTSTTLTGYWDGSFISDAITATTPTTYNNKTVTEASLDGVAWYTYSPSAETWNTILDSTVQYNPDSSEQYPYCWLSTLSDIYPTDGSVWRVTWNGTTYRCTATTSSGVVVIGNPKFATGADDGSNVPFAFANQGWGAWSGLADLPNTAESHIPVKIEQLVSS